MSRKQVPLWAGGEAKEGVGGGEEHRGGEWWEEGGLEEGPREECSSAPVALQGQRGE